MKTEKAWPYGTARQGGVPKRTTKKWFNLTPADAEALRFLGKKCGFVNEAEAVRYCLNKLAHEIELRMTGEAKKPNHKMYPHEVTIEGLKATAEWSAREERIRLVLGGIRREARQRDIGVEPHALCFSDMDLCNLKYIIDYFALSPPTSAVPSTTPGVRMAIRVVSWGDGYEPPIQGEYKGESWI